MGLGMRLPCSYIRSLWPWAVECTGMMLPGHKECPGHPSKRYVIFIGKHCPLLCTVSRPLSTHSTPLACFSCVCTHQSCHRMAFVESSFMCTLWHIWTDSVNGSYIIGAQPPSYCTTSATSCMQWNSCKHPLPHSPSLPPSLPPLHSTPHWL